MLDGGWDTLLRMFVTPDTFVPLPSASVDIVSLTTSDAPELRRFYGPMARGPFPEEQLEHGMFRGIRVNGELASAAGTHVLSRKYGIAVVGGVMTAIPYRRQGFSRMVTAALTGALFDAGCSLVALNVQALNTAAIALYESLGYQSHCRLITVMGAPSRVAA